MRRTRIICALAVLYLAAAPVMADLATLNLSLEPTNTTWPWDVKQRWKDVADNLYAAPVPTTTSLTQSDVYDNANVTVNYGVVGNKLTGTLTATGLKPNFAYQMKLEGSTDKWTNDTLLKLGRDSGGTGYLLFDFFLTDASGNATTTFVTDSSFHVLHKTPGSSGTYGIRTPGMYDGPVTDFSFNPDTSSDWYGVDYGPAAGGIYGEWESGRDLPGTLFLPDGEYICKFVLTEESFHDTTAGSVWTGAPGGAWASPFKGDITFTVVPLPGAVALGVIGLGFANWRLRRRREA